MDPSEEKAQYDAVISNLESILQQIESQGGVHEGGRQALERLKATLEQGSHERTDDVPVMQQMEDIRLKLSTLEKKVSTMSDDTQTIVSAAGGDAIQSLLQFNTTTKES
mmetsp:Transcript_12497/g.25102  ORF Transcript_12497/g.25102 Transcript_12497/m.25102 type:complete len:109 (+) Transcript_12497:133-459(+)